MISEAINALVTLANKAQNPNVHMHSLGGRRRLVVLRGESSEIMVEPESFHREVLTIDSLAVLIEEFGTESTTVMIGEGGLTCVLDETDRRETIEMSFEDSDQFRALANAAAGIKQRSLLRMLRTQLAGCFSDPDLISTISRLEFKRRSDGASTVEHGRESLGRSVERAVQSTGGDIPEQLRFDFPLYSSPIDIDTHATVDFAVDLDIENERIALIPIGDQLGREKKRVLNELMTYCTKQLTGTTVALGQLTRN